MRVILKEPRTGKKVLDLVLSEKHIIDVKAVNAVNVYQLREEVVFAFNTGFKDSYALFQKIPELITDFKQAFIEIEERVRLTAIEDHSVLLHRKVVSLSRQTFIIYVKADTLVRAEKQFKVILFEQASGYEEAFLFDSSTVLTKEEMAVLAQAVKQVNEKQIRDCLVKVVETRLRIKTMGEDMQLTAPPKGSRDRYVVYFMESSALAPEGPGSGKALTEEHQKFDIRSGFRFSLTNPETVLPEPEYIPQEK